MDDMEYFTNPPKGVKIYKILHRNFTPEDLQKAYDEGLIPMDKLEDGVLYKGHCRNASKARWNAEKQVFVYSRYKFGRVFDEDIEPPERDRGFDIFIAVEKIDE